MLSLSRENGELDRYPDRSHPRSSSCYLIVTLPLSRLPLTL